MVWLCSFFVSVKQINSYVGFPILDQTLYRYKDSLVLSDTHKRFSDHSTTELFYKVRTIMASPLTL